MARRTGFATPTAYCNFLSGGVLGVQGAAQRDRGAPETRPWLWLVGTRLEKSKTAASAMDGRSFDNGAARHRARRRLCVPRTADAPRRSPGTGVARTCRLGGRGMSDVVRQAELAAIVRWVLSLS